jgi:outer membrane protein TolC
LQKEWTTEQQPPEIGLNSGAQPPPAWWQDAFNDPVLNSLVEQALADNLILRSAALRVLQARQSLAIAVGSHLVLCV